MNYVNNLQNQSSALPPNFIQSTVTPTAIFSSAIQALQNELFSNIMTSLNMDKNRKQNILLVSVCKLIDKIATHDTLLNKFIDKEEKSQDNMMYSLGKRLNNIEQLLQQTISHKQDAITFDKSMHALENKLENKLQSIQQHLATTTNKYNKLDHKLTAIQKDLKQIQTQSIINAKELNTINEQMRRISRSSENMHKINNTLNNTMNSVNKKVNELTKQTQKQIQSMHTKMDGNITELNEGLMAQSIAMQSIKDRLDKLNETQDNQAAIKPFINASKTPTKYQPPAIVCKTIATNDTNNNNNILSENDISDNIYLPSLSCGIYGSYLVSSKKLQQPDTDSATTPKTFTQIVTSAVQPTKSTQNTHTLLSVSTTSITTKNTIQNVTKSPIINTKSTNNTSKSIPTSNASSQSFVASPKLTTIPTNASTTPETLSVSCENVANNNNNILSENIINNNIHLPSVSSGIYGSYLAPSKPIVTSSTSTICASAVPPTSPNGISPTGTSCVLPTLPTSPKKINEQYFSKYSPTTPTLSYTSKQQFLYYFEDDHVQHEFEEYKRSGRLVMNPNRSSKFWEHKIDINVKKLARNPFSAASIIPSKDAIEEAIKNKEEGNEWYSKKQFHIAIEHYQVAQDFDPTNAVYKLNESAATFMLKDYDGTIRCCREALLYANDAKYKCKAYKRMGIVEERRGNIDKCIKYYTKAQDEKYDSDLKKKIKTLHDKHMM